MREEVRQAWENYKARFPEWIDEYRRLEYTEGEDKTKAAEVINQLCEAMTLMVQQCIRFGDLEDGRMIGDETLKYIDIAIDAFTHADFKTLEEYSQREKVYFPLIELHYKVLLLEAPHFLEAFCLYVEKDRPQKERFYEPRIKTLHKVVEAFQKLENDGLDRLFIHMPARVGKTQITTFYMVWHCARNTELSNLYVTYKEGLGGAFIDGVIEIITDPTYRFSDVFESVKITDTDAKNNKLDLGTDRRRRKKYKTLSGKGLESGLNGEYDASGVMILDDILEGVQDVLSKDVLERKRTIYQNNVVPRKKEACKVIFMGTIWATDDIYMKQLEFYESDPTSQSLRVQVIKIPALDAETDESNFDYEYGVGFSTAYYRSRRAEFEMNNDLAGWWCQCQQEPIDRQGAVFIPEHMNYYSELPAGVPIKVISHIDVASGGGDFLSMPIAYYYEEENGDLVGYIEDVVFDNSEKHITQPQVVSKIKKHRISQLHVEANAGGEGYADDIKRLLKEEKYKEPCNIRSDYALVTKRKQQRIWDNAEDIRKLYFKDPTHRDTQYKKFMSNLFSFSMNMSKRAHDDACDSLSGLIDFERNGSGVSTAVIMRSLF